MRTCISSKRFLYSRFRIRCYQISSRKNPLAHLEGGRFTEVPTRILCVIGFVAKVPDEIFGHSCSPDTVLEELVEAVKFLLGRSLHYF